MNTELKSWDYLHVSTGAPVDLLTDETIVAARNDGWQLDKAIYEPEMQMWNALLKRPRN